MSAPTEYLTTDDVAKMLSMKVGTLRAWRHAGDGPRSVRFVGAVRYRRDDVMAWIEAQEASTGRGESSVTHRYPDTEAVA